MNSLLKYSYQNDISNNQNINNFRFSDILFNSSKSKNANKNYNLGETLKNSELYKYNVTQRKEAIKIMYKIKYLLKKRLYFIYLDTSTIYNKMIINNILANKFSIIKEKYIEMLNETEQKEFINNYIPKNKVYYYLKYLIVTYDNFQLHYPNYLKDINVYSIMSKYLLNKQKMINRASLNNKYVYLQKRIKKLLYKKNHFGERILSTSLSMSESNEENHYIKLIENSQDSLGKLENLATKIGKNIKRKNNEFKFTRSRSIKHNDILLLKFPSIEKSQRVQRETLYENSNKKIKRNLRRKGTEIKWNKNRINIEKVIPKDNLRKRVKKKNMLDKPSKKHDLKKLIFLNEVGNNKKVYDVMKRGFFYSEEKSSDKNDNENEKLKNSKNNFKVIEDNQENEAENKLIKKIKSLSKAKKKFSYNNYYNGDNYKLFKNLKYIIKNLNDSLNEYRFYNKKNDYNNNERKQFYEKKVIPALFNNKMDSLLNNQNLKRKNDINNQKRKVHSLGSTTPSQKKYNTSSDAFCKKLDKFNSSLNKKNRNSNLILPFYNTNKKNDYYDLIMLDKTDDNTKKLSNKLERVENSIYQFFKTNKKNNKIPLLKYKLNFINKINLAESNAYSKNNKYKKINTFITKTNYKNRFFKKKEGSKNSKEIYNTIFCNSDNSNGDFCSIKDKYNSSIKNKRYHTLSNNNIKDLKIKGIKIKFSHDLIKKIK